MSGVLTRPPEDFYQRIWEMLCQCRGLVIGDQLFRLAQDCESVYGKQVRAFEITTLTTECYAERPARELPILKPAAAGWNSTGMHHLDAQMLATGQWLACVDGWTWVDP